MSAPALALSFFDAAHDIHGTSRSGATILFEDRKPLALPGGPSIEQSGEGWRAECPSSRSSSSRWRQRWTSVTCAHGSCGCTARRPAAGSTALGTLSETEVPPRWEELDAIRSISALVDERHALLAIARRPRDAVGHGDEVVTARLVEDDAVLTVDNARISTVYDGAGHQRSAGLELWVPGEDYARRGSGQVIAGSSFDLEGLEVHVAVFRWRLDGREGIGAYELMSRTEPPAAA